MISVNLSSQKWFKLILVTMFMAISVYILVVALLVAAPEITDYFNPVSFEENRWKNWEEGPNEEGWGLRWRMMSSLLAEHPLVGLSRNKVIDLLGVPDGEERNAIYYYLGITGHGIDTGTLYIYFDSRKRVIKYEKWHG